MGTWRLDDSLMRHLYRRSGSADARQEYLIDRFSECQTEALGGRILGCRGCGTRVVQYNPCNVRGCPKCAPYHQGQWRSAMQRRILPIGHYHITFSGPGWLTQLWLMRPAEVISALFGAASATLKAMFRPVGLLYGSTLVFQSHGQRLCYKPHIHCLLTPGGVDREGKWQAQRHINEASLREQFSRRLLRSLERTVVHQLNVVLGSSRGGENRCGVYATYHRGSPDPIIGYLARTVGGLVLDPKTEIQVGEATVSYHYTHNGERCRCELSDRQFLTRYLAHIPPPRAVTVRHYGLYATTHTGMLEWVRPQLQSEIHSVEPPAEEELFLPRCPACHRRRLAVESEFEAHQLPLELRLLAQIRGSPVPNNLILSSPELHIRTRQ